MFKYASSMDFWTSLGSYGVKMAVAISENPLSDFEQELLGSRISEKQEEHAISIVPTRRRSGFTAVVR